MAPFLDLSRLSFEIWKATRHLLDVRLTLFFGPLDHDPSDVGLDQGNHWLGAKENVPPRLSYCLLCLVPSSRYCVQCDPYALLQGFVACFLDSCAGWYVG